MVSTTQKRDHANPSPWETLYGDQAIPVDPVAKTYMVQDLQNWTRNYLDLESALELFKVIY